jgi:LDH2 family malate/lactate/ureidoglycolate dehydrogenase
MPEAVYVPAKKLADFMIEAFLKMGTPRADAEIAADVLLASDLYGVRSHGIAHLRWYFNRIKAGLQKPVTAWKIVHETLTTAVVDGGNGMGMVVGYRAMEIAIEKARRMGIGAVAVRNSSHYGIAGYYSRMAAREGMVGMSFTNAHPSIAPTFGVEPMLGTNPIAFSAPTDEDFPFTFDAATSIAPRGKIEIAARARKPIPEGWVIREDGMPVTDSSTLIEEMNQGRAALLPLGGSGELMGGHKGYGLATMVEILSAAFQDGAFLSQLHDKDDSGNLRPSRIGHFFLAFNIENFVPLANFKKTAGSILRELREYGRSPEDIPGETRIYTAGEKAYGNEKRAMAEGVRIPPSVQQNLRALCAELGISHNLGF